MRITFLGVGEAFDPSEPNISILVETKELSMLLDCGATSGLGIWRYAQNPLELDAIYISHFHGDHYFGIPALLTRSVEEGRTKLLRIIGQEGVEDYVSQIVKLAYPSILGKAKFPVEFIECSQDISGSVHGVELGFAPTGHKMPCLAVRMDCDGKSLFYSGDGDPTAQTDALAHGCDCIIHESYTLTHGPDGHSSIPASLAFAKKAQTKQLACIHVRSDIRSSRADEIRDLLASARGFTAFMPERGDVIEL